MQSLVTALLVAARIGATTWANVVQKRMLRWHGYSPLALFIAVWGWMTLLASPWWISALAQGTRFWCWLLLTCLLEVPGNVLLLRSLHQTELSIFGPLSSYKPAISLLLALLLFHEVPNGLGVLGVLIVLAGSILLTGGSTSQTSDVSHAQRRAGVRDRLLAVLLTAAASVFLKQALYESSPWQVLGAWCLLSWLLALLWQWSAQYLRDQSIQPPMVAMDAAADTAEGNAPLASAALPEPTLLRKRISVLLVALAMLAMQGCTISLFARMPVGYALALFQIGSLVSVIIGHRMFGEGQVMRRFIAAIIMVLGAVVIIVAG